MNQHDKGSRNSCIIVSQNWEACSKVVWVGFPAKTPIFEERMSPMALLFGKNINI